MPQFRSAQPRDAIALGPRLRTMDTLECNLMFPNVPATLVLLAGVVEADMAVTIADDNDEALAIFGVSPSGNEQIGLVWLLGSDGLLRHRTELLRKAEGSIQKMLTLYPCLTNVVHAENHVHRRWLHHMRFRKLGVEEHGGHPFIQFARML